LADTDPGNAQWQRDIGVVYGRIGLLAYKKNDLPAALDAFENAEKIALHVKEISPTAVASTMDLAWVQTRLEETRRKIAAPAAGKLKK